MVSRAVHGPSKLWVALCQVVVVRLAVLSIVLVKKETLPDLQGLVD